MVLRIRVKLIAVITALVVLLGGYSFVSFLVADAVESGEGVRVPVIMYHQVLKASSAQGKYTVSPTQLEEDIKYMQSLGYTSVFISDLLDYVEGKGELPEKPMVLTFDDGYETVLAYVLPILRKYNAKAVVSVVGAYADLYSQSDLVKNLSYSYLNWDEISTLNESGLVEIQNHSYDMHEPKGERQGCKMAAGETNEQYSNALKDDLLLNQKKIIEATKTTPICMTYPYGYYNKASEAIIKQLGFKASLSCEEGVSFIEKGNPNSLFRIKRYNRPSNVDKAFFEKITAKAIK